MAHRCGKRWFVISLRTHLGGGINSHDVEGINVYLYNPHVLRLSNRQVWPRLNAPKASVHRTRINKHKHLEHFGNNIYARPQTIVTTGDETRYDGR